MKNNQYLDRMKGLINYLLGKIYLRPIITALRSSIILEYEYGHFISSLKWSAVDKDGNLIPWICYPAIEYLKQLDLKNKYLFEYGSGNSTIFWASKCKKSVCVENNKSWYNKISRELKNNTKILFVPDEESYVNSIHKFKNLFDIIVIDGSFRNSCAKEAIKKLKSGGVIILDNSDWFPKTAKYIRSKNLIQIDFIGFGPINPYTSVTSFFLHRNYNFRPLKGIQPKHVPGGIRHCKD